MLKPTRTQNFMLLRICKPHTSLKGKATMARSISMAKVSTAIHRCSYVYMSAYGREPRSLGVSAYRAKTESRTLYPRFRYLLTKTNDKN